VSCANDFAVAGRALIAICSALDLAEVAEIHTEARRDLPKPRTRAQRHHRLSLLEAQLLGVIAPWIRSSARLRKSSYRRPTPVYLRTRSPPTSRRPQLDSCHVPASGILDHK
jgi:hypothetical protein